jgi:hypothetical protein
MGFPLQDITIYYRGSVIKDAPEDWDFRRTVNYITDFYHDRLHGYKPPKTGRICIHLGPTKDWDKPHYFGAICSFDNIIDEEKYLTLSKLEKYKYILDLLHKTITELADIYDWDKSVFINAQNHILESGFKFEKHYPEKKSKDRKHVGQIILIKTEEKSSLLVQMKTGDNTTRQVLLEKNNWYWYDSSYNMAKSCKWLDNSSFGLYKNGQNCYYSLESNEIINDLTFEPDHF